MFDYTTIVDRLMMVSLNAHIYPAGVCNLPLPETPVLWKGHTFKIC